jgi:outer membrane protein assembly factor BamB
VLGPDGTLYVATGGAQIAALDPADGGTIWTYSASIDASYQASPVLAADSTLRVFNFADWTYARVNLDASAPTPVAPGYQTRGYATIGSNGALYFPATAGGELVALRAGGDILWNVSDATTDFAYPAIGADGTVFTNTNSTRLSATHGDGGYGWRAIFDAGPISTPAVAVDGSLRVYSFSNLYAVDAATGEEIWNRPADDGGINGIAVGDDGTTYVAGSTQFDLFGPDGKPGPTLPGTNCRGPTIDSNGDVYAVCGTELRSFDSALHPRWRQTIPNYYPNSMRGHVVIGPGNRAYVASGSGASGAIDAFGPP